MQKKGKTYDSYDSQDQILIPDDDEHPRKNQGSKMEDNDEEINSYGRKDLIRDEKKDDGEFLESLEDQAPKKIKKRSKPKEIQPHPNDRSK